MNEEYLEELEEQADNGDADAIKKLMDYYRENGDIEASEEYEEMLRQFWNDTGDDSFYNAEDSGRNERRDGLQTDRFEGSSVSDTYRPERTETTSGSVDKSERKVWKRDEMAVWQLASECELGNPYAMIQMGEKCLKSSGQEKRGFRWYIKALQIFEQEGTDTDALVDMHLRIGRLYENGKGGYKNPTKAYEHYCNAREVDRSKIEDVIRCLENGIGCSRSPEKALAVREDAADLSDIMSCYQLAAEAKALGSNMKYISYLQRALLAANASLHPRERALSRLYLAEVGETDPYGTQINLKSAVREVTSYLEKDDAIELATMLYNGDGCEKDPELADSVLKAVYNVKKIQECYELAMLYLKWGNIQACRQCLNLALKASDAYRDMRTKGQVQITLADLGQTEGVNEAHLREEGVKALTPFAEQGDVKYIRLVTGHTEDIELKKKLWGLISDTDTSDDAMACRQEIAMFLEEQRRTEINTAADRKKRWLEELHKRVNNNDAEAIWILAHLENWPREKRSRAYRRIADDKNNDYACLCKEELQKIDG